ncbi:dermonecrotic toxin domain-containing protein [Pseudomonas koreensis]|uniref:dermonecrotic toxin domain-containing protein n=1 Tax=Pseudomonas koreensis TaxID=198620 RepID=UPI003209D9FF
MSHALPSATADFGLDQRLQPYVDQTLYLLATARLNDCHQQWLDLLAHHPQQPESAWWDVRAPGTALSRREHALSLYHRHFEAALHWAGAEGRLDATQRQRLSQLLPPSNKVAADLRVAQPVLNRVDNSRLRVYGTLLIKLEETLLLYLPTHSQPLIRFEQQTALERWLIDQQPDPLRITSLDFIEFGSDPLTRAIEPLLSTSASSGASWAALDKFFPVAPTLPESAGQTVDEVAPFGLLVADIPLDARRQTLALEQRALDRLFGDAELNSPQRQQLAQRFDALSEAQQASHDAASALLDSHHPLTMLELRQASNQHYHALLQARIAGLRAEVELQRALDQLTVEEHRRVIAMLDAPGRNLPTADGVIARVSLATTNEGVTAVEELHGVLIIATTAALAPDSSDSLLLYWPGHFGGLQRFTSRAALEQNLFKRSPNDGGLTLHLTPLAGDSLVWSLDQQLYDCEQQAAQILRDNPLPGRADERRAEMEKLREQHMPRLTVAVAQARERAFAERQAQDRSAALAGNLPAWFEKLDDAPRAQIKTLISQYLGAMQRAHALLERELPPRQAFAEQRIDARLRADFALKQSVSVSLDLPDSTFWQKTVMEGAAPGTPQRNILTASDQRGELTLEQLAQENIDQDMEWRLSFMRARIRAENPTDRQRLEAGITPAYLRNLVTELDLPGLYEELIRQAFFGAPGEPAFQQAWRRECLSEPWRLMLRLQGEFALLQRHIDNAGHAVLKVAIEANTPQAYAVNGQRIALLPVHLTVGGEDTAHQGPSTLAGVTLIVEQTSGLTLLYQPDSPDAIFLRQYETLEQARVDLFRRCVDSNVVSYLAGRTVSGDFASHVSRINQAQLRNFDALIGVGMAWPATTSLAIHLLNVHMGRLLEAHRSSSRSNDALYLERCALKSGALFNYLKMAIGMLPFVGAAVALYDAWNSANLAVAAFLRGELGHGLAEVEAVLLSLIDAAMDVLPGTVSAPAAARLASRQRQRAALGRSAAMSTSWQWARQSLERFKGYEYEFDISLAGLHSATHGVYRNVYRHADGDFIIRQGRIYRVQLSDAPRGWRLYGSRMRSYKQPIALDENGQWNTHYAVYGTVMDGGGAGGGAVLGHLADGMDPLWPAPIRQWLPRWWTDRQLRRQLTLTNTADAYTRRLDNQTRASNQLLENYQKLDVVQRKPLQAALDTACLNDIDLAIAQYDNLTELLPLSHGRKRLQIEDIRSRCAWIVVDRAVQRVTLARNRLLEHLNRIDALVAESDATPFDNTAAHINLMARRKQVRKDFLKEFDQLHVITEQANLWNNRISNRAQKVLMAKDMTALNRNLGDNTHHYLRTAHLLEIITHYDAVSDLSWMYFHTQLRDARVKVGRALLTQHHLPEVSASLVERKQVIEDCLQIYAGFRRQLNAWTLGYAQHLDLEQVGPFLDGLTKVEAHARHSIKQRPPIKPKEPGGRQLFETEDNQLLIGTESIDPGTREKRFTVEGIDGFRETWLPRATGKYHLQARPAPAAAPLPADVQPLLAEARKRLAAVPAYSNRVQAYASQDMLPVDLEHMLFSEATELSTRAQTIERLSPTEPVVRQLHDTAAELRRTGRTLRIDQSLRSKMPTEGYLDYLLQQQVVEIRKEGSLRALGKRADGRKDFLQEYQVRDLTSTPPRTLWYAHFHYTSDKVPFADFVKAHLKLPEQRNLGLQWQQAQAAGGAQVEAIWRGDIGKPLGIRHFADL